MTGNLARRTRPAIGTSPELSYVLFRIRQTAGDRGQRGDDVVGDAPLAHGVHKRELCVEQPRAEGDAREGDAGARSGGHGPARERGHEQRRRIGGDEPEHGPPGLRRASRTPTPGLLSRLSGDCSRRALGVMQPRASRRSRVRTASAPTAARRRSLRVLSRPSSTWRNSSMGWAPGAASSRRPALCRFDDGVPDTLRPGPPPEPRPWRRHLLLLGRPSSSTSSPGTEAPMSRKRWSVTSRSSRRWLWNSSSPTFHSLFYVCRRTPSSGSAVTESSQESRCPERRSVPCRAGRTRRRDRRKRVEGPASAVGALVVGVLDDRHRRGGLAEHVPVLRDALEQRLCASAVDCTPRPARPSLRSRSRR